MAVLSFYAEVLDEALPEHDPQETVFRLLVVRAGADRPAVERQSLDAADLFLSSG